MKSVKQNLLLILFGLSLAFSALSTVIDASNFVYDFDTGIQTADYTLGSDENDSRNHSKYFLDDRSTARAFLSTRRSSQQMHFRHQRGNSVQGFSGRDVVLQVRLGGRLEKWFTTAVKKCDGYPSNAVFCTAKEYYVFTLKRILC